MVTRFPENQSDPRIEYLRVQNYRVLKEVELKMSLTTSETPL